MKARQLWTPDRCDTRVMHAPSDPRSARATHLKRNQNNNMSDKSLLYRTLPINNAHAPCFVHVFLLSTSTRYLSVTEAKENLANNLAWCLKYCNLQQKHNFQNI